MINRTHLSAVSAMVVAFKNNNYFVGCDGGLFSLLTAETWSFGIILAQFFFEEYAVISSSTRVGAWFSVMPTTRRSSSSTGSVLRRQTPHSLIRNRSAAQRCMKWCVPMIPCSIQLRGCNGRCNLTRQGQIVPRGILDTIDECGRHWFALGSFLVHIFDDQGTWLGNFSLSTGYMMDTLIITWCTSLNGLRAEVALFVSILTFSVNSKVERTSDFFVPQIDVCFVITMAACRDIIIWLHLQSLITSFSVSNTSLRTN